MCFSHTTGSVGFKPIAYVGEDQSSMATNIKIIENKQRFIRGYHDLNLYPGNRASL